MLVRTLSLATLVLVAGCGLETESDSSTSDPFADASPESLSAQRQFLVDNAARDGVTVTPSGLQYEVLRSADGPMPAPGAVVTVDYAGTLIDGRTFDSSYERGEPATFALGGVIAGFGEGLQLMSVGSRYRLVLPSELAYGDAGAGTRILPGDTLIFEVELLEIGSS